MATSDPQTGQSASVAGSRGHDEDTTSNSAGQNLCDVTELLEAILYELPTRELSKVNKQCKAVIEGSPKLQQALFYHPLPGSYSPFSTTKQYYAVKNPLLKPILDALSNAGEEGSALDLIDQLFHENELHKSWTYEYASWLDMFPTQPPMESPLYVDFTNDHYEDHDQDLYDVYGIANPETTAYARCSASKLTMSELILGLHVLAKKIWEPGALTSINESESFRVAEELHSNRQLLEITRLRANGEVVRSVPLGGQGSPGYVSDADWRSYDSDYELDGEMGHFLATGERLSGPEGEEHDEMESAEESESDDYQSEDESEDENEDGYGS